MKFSQPLIPSFAFLIIFFLSSCGSKDKELDKALNLAGDNRKELQFVIDHYSSPKDSLKLQAAQFLIKNMRNKYSLESKQLRAYDTVFSSIEEIRNNKVLKIRPGLGGYPEVDSVWKTALNRIGPISSVNFEVRPDLKYIKADFLIENIEYAFKAWKLPWARHLSFDEFCNYILPYRFLNERLTSWRPVIFEKYRSKIDSLKSLKITNPMKVCKILNTELSSSWLYSHTLTQYPVAMTLDDLVKAKMGSCTDNAALGIYVMRALGIPVIHEQVPHYANRSLGHDFIGILGKDDKFHDFEIGMPIGEVVNTRFRWNYLIPKIYRQSFSISKNSLAMVKPESEDVPPYFLNPHLIDVTKEYLPVKDITISLTDPLRDAGYVYLCVFDNQKWQSVSWAKIQNGKAVFTSMGLGVVYMPMYFRNNQLIPASNPIILHANGKNETITFYKRPQKMALRRKYKPKKYLWRNMIGSEFQASNQKDFGNAVNLYNIKDTLNIIPHTIKAVPAINYQYIRYIFPRQKEGDIAEISVYSGGEELEGQVMTAKNMLNNQSVKNAFDGNVLTFAHNAIKDEQSWIGIDLRKRKNISKITFCPRTDKNDIWPGLTYELYYWDDGWKSLGRKKAARHTIVFQSPISNALFLLRCLDEGKEERIFTFENGKQIWW